MSDWMPSASFFRRGSPRFLLCGSLLGVVLFAAHLHVLAVVVVLVSVAAAGASRRLEEQARAAAQAPGGFVAPAEAEARAGAGVLADRQALDRRLEAEWKRDHREGEPTSLVLIAVDGFEELEGQGGALAGDVAMLTVASALARMLPRAADLLARYDASTFAVMLSGTDLPGSLRVAARLRWAIVRLGIAHPKAASGFLTASMGVAVHHGLPAEGTMTLLRAAENALGAAKRIGPDSLEYVVMGLDAATPGQAAGDAVGVPLAARLPAIRAWTPERAQAMHSPQS